MVKPWPVLESHQEKSFRIFSLRTDRLLSPRTNKAYDFYVLEAPSWVNIIPLTPDHHVVMVRQWRHGIREVTLEIPGGMVEGKGDPEEAAIRELREETGYRPGRVIPLGYVHPNPAIQNNVCYTFLALDCTLGGEPEQDEKEDIEVDLLPLSEIPQLIAQGAISHALVICAFHRYQLWKDGVIHRP